MQKLGLIGGTGPESTIEYYRALEYGVQQRSGRNFFPNLTIESLSVFDVLAFCEAKDYAGLTAYLAKAFRTWRCRRTVRGFDRDYASYRL